MISFLTSKLGLSAIVVVAVLFAAGVIYFQGQSSGRNAARLDQLGKTIEIQRSITDADARGSRTPDDVDRRLHDGSF